MQILERLGISQLHGLIGQGLNSRGAGRCVLNILRQFTERKKECLIFLDEEDYEWVGVQVRDKNLVSPPLRTLEVVSLFSNKEQFRFGIRSLKDYRKRQPDGSLLPVKEFRLYVFIDNGQLHTPKFQAALDPATFSIFQETGIIEAKENYSPSGIYQISLEGLPLIPYTCWAQPWHLISSIRKEKELETWLEATKILVKKYETEGLLEKEETSHKEKSGPVTEDQATQIVDCVQYHLMDFQPKESDSIKLGPEEARQAKNELNYWLDITRASNRANIWACELFEKEAGYSLIDWQPHENPRTPKEEWLADFNGAQLRRWKWTKEEARTVS